MIRTASASGNPKRKPINEVLSCLFLSVNHTDVLLCVKLVKQKLGLFITLHIINNFGSSTLLNGCELVKQVKQIFWEPSQIKITPVLTFTLYFHFYLLPFNYSSSKNLSLSFVILALLLDTGVHAFLSLTQYFSENFVQKLFSKHLCKCKNIQQKVRWLRSK